MASTTITTREHLTQGEYHAANGTVRTLSPELAARVSVDPSRDYGRSDGDPRPESGLPALVISGRGRVLGEVWNGAQAEAALVGDLSGRIVCGA